MVSSGPEIVYGYVRRSNSGTSSKGRSDFSSANSVNMHKGTKSVESMGDLNSEEMDIRMILKDIKQLGSSNMTWKERKKLEDQNVVCLGGKPPKNEKRNLGVSKVFMKTKKKKEEKKLEQESFLGRFVKQPREKEPRTRRQEDRVLRSTEGYFKKGVLDVKHLLNPTPAKGRDNMRDEPIIGRGRKKGKGKGKGRKEKGGGKKRH